MHPLSAGSGQTKESSEQVAAQEQSNRPTRPTGRFAALKATVENLQF